MNATSHLSGKRLGFTLLEVLLSAGIGVLLMGALYTAMSMQLRHAQAGRDVVEQSLLVRALLTRMGNDVQMNLGPVTPAQPAQSTSTATTATAQAAPTTTGTAATTDPAATSTTTTSATTTAMTTGTSVVTLNIGVQGDSSQLTLVISRLPRDANYGVEGQPTVCDIRRISYWLAGNGGTGLCRMENKQVTAEDVDSAVPGNVPDENQYVIAEEVKSLQFQYFDGSSWLDSWDGTEPGADGMTPKGPPLAIAIIIGVPPPGKLDSDGDYELKTFRHVVSIPTANGTGGTATETTTTSTTGN